MKQRALSAMLWSAIEQIGAKGLSTIFMLIFARYLSADDFGIFAAASLAIGFVSTVAQFGLNTVIVQRPAMDSRVLSTAFWMAFAGSAVMAGGLAVLARPFAHLFGNTAIAPLVPVLAVGMVIAVASAMVTALLRRELKMKALARRTLLANTISGAIATPFILNGLGAWGLVIQSVGGAVMTLVLTILLIGWPVRWTFDRLVALNMMRFGAPVMAANLVRHYTNESPSIFVGVFLGVEALGIFAMAMRVMNLLLQVMSETLTRVALPVLSKVNRDIPDRMAEIYLRVMHLTGAVILPIFMLVIVLRQPLVDVVLGPYWSEIVPILAFLSGSALLMNFTYVNGATLLALGKPEARLYFFLIRAVVGTALLFLATPFGVVAVGAAVLFRGLIVEPIQLIYLLGLLKETPSNYLRQLQGSAMAALILVIVGIGMLSLDAWLSPAILLSLVGFCAMLAYGIVLFILDKPLCVEIRYLANQTKIRS